MATSTLENSKSQFASTELNSQKLQVERHDEQESTEDSSPHQPITSRGSLLMDEVAERTLYERITVPVDGVNLTKSPRYYDYRKSDGLDYRGRPLHDTIHYECANSPLDIREPNINLRGFWVLLGCIAFASNVEGAMFNVRKNGFVATLSPKLDRALYNEIRSVFIGCFGLFLCATVIYILQTSFDSAKRPITSEDKKRLRSEKTRQTLLYRSQTTCMDADDLTECISDVIVPSSKAERISRPRSKTDNIDVSSDTDVPTEPSKSDVRLAKADSRIRRILSIIVLITMSVGGHHYVSTQFNHWLFRGFTLLAVATIAMKLISFMHVCSDYRKAYIQGTPWIEIGGTAEDIDMLLAMKHFSDIFSFPHFVRFWAMPTLIFQFSYPSTKRIDWARCFIHICFFFAEAFVIRLLKSQYIVTPLDELFTGHEWASEQSIFRLAFLVLEYVLRLSTPLMISWVLFFLMFFHHGMNVAAELTYFGDRAFYLDWWNSAGFAEYWRKWNLPVHNFATRHIYKPLMSRGINSVTAGVIIFTISAWAHEYLINTTWQIPYTYLVFASFVLQLPLIVLLDGRMKGDRGNILFWMVFCVTGQPIAMAFIYYTVGTTEGYLESINLKMSDSSEALLILETVSAFSKITNMTELGQLSVQSSENIESYLNLLKDNLEHGHHLVSKHGQNVLTKFIQSVTTTVTTTVNY